MIIETIMPLDYYSNMVGALLDQKTFSDILKERMPDLYEHLEDVGYGTQLIAFQWFACFFSYNLPYEVSITLALTTT
jgi:hypothetical protein